MRALRAGADDAHFGVKSVMAKLTQSRKFAEAHFLPGRVRLWASKFVFWLFAILYFLAFTVLLVRLGSMRLDGLATTGLAVLAVSFAFSSLMYNRARAHPNGQVQRRSLLAAEHATRANLWFVIALALGAAIFFALNDLGYSAANSCDLFSKRTLGCSHLPLFLAFAVCIPLLVGLTAFTTALKVLIGKAVGFLLTRPFLRRNAGENLKSATSLSSSVGQQIERHADQKNQGHRLEIQPRQRLRMRFTKPGLRQKN